MSVQFGKCRLDGKSVNPKELDRVRRVLAPYGPDGEGHFCRDNFAVLYRAFHTTKESRLEVQPHFCPSGAVITWDGRLDNREELIHRLAREISFTSTDLEIVAAAYQSWGTGSFARLIGDWALSIWEPKSRSVLLAKDFVGTRHLFYSVENDEVTWCSILDPLVLFAGHSFKIQEEYIAGWLSFFPATHLTPYVGIHAVPPSSFVRLRPRKRDVIKYWDFDSSKSIRYRSDGEYEEHFRAAFSQSVFRRLRSDRPILAELSGGLDSSSIVCVADDLIANGHASSTNLYTVSYWDDTEPNWDERPYFKKVEERRGRIGSHIDVSSQNFFDTWVEEGTFVATPSGCGSSKETQFEFASCLASHASRVVLSGIGGDEVTGGVPTPLPELEDLLARFQFRLIGRLKQWALTQRQPWIHLLAETMRAFLPGFILPTAIYKRPISWLKADFARRYKAALAGYESRLRFFGPLPSFQENILTLEGLRRQLSSDISSRNPLCQKTYPYLDRDLLEFIYAIPREQVVRPGQRRSLMRRALSGIVPKEILSRRRKGYVARSPLVAISNEWHGLKEMCGQLLSASLGIVDSEAYVHALEQARVGYEIPIVIAKRTQCMELWLRNAADFLVIPPVSLVAPSDLSADTRSTLVAKSTGMATQSERQ